MGEGGGEGSGGLNVFWSFNVFKNEIERERERESWRKKERERVEKNRQTRKKRERVAQECVKVNQHF